MKKLLQLIPLLLLVSPAMAQVVIPGTGGTTTAPPAGQRTSVIPGLCTGTDKIIGITATGAIQCNTDVTGTTSPLTTKGDLWGFSTLDVRLPVGSNDLCLVADSTQTLGFKWGSCAVGGSGITSLGGETGSTQTFSKVNDTNVTLIIASASDDHKFTLGWTGTLADSRLAQITTASKVSGAAITLLTSVPSGAGDLPLANFSDGTGFLKGAGGAGTPAYAAIADGDVPNGITIDLAAAATALAADPDNCAANNLAAGITAAGVAEGCADPILESELDTEAKLETQITDMANIIQATEIDTVAELATILSDEDFTPGSEASAEGVLDLPDFQGQISDTQIADGAVDGGTGGEIADGSVTAADLGTDSVSADELNATGVEAELEAVIDLPDLQGQVAAGQYAAASIDGDDLASGLAGTGITLTAASPDTLDCDAASTTAVGCPEMAIASEVNTGTSTILAVTPDALAGSTFGQVEVQMVAFDFTTAVATGDGKFYFHIPTGSKLIGMNLIDVVGAVITVSSSGAITVDVARCAPVATGNPCAGTVADALSTNLTIDADEDSSDTAATPSVVDTSLDDVIVDQMWRVDVDGAGTGTKGLIVTLIFQLP